MQLSCKLRTVVAETLQYEVYTIQPESGRKFHIGYGKVLHAERFPAAGAVEMSVKFLRGALARSSADGIFNRTRTIVYAVYEFVIMEQMYRAREGRFVHGVELLLQIGKAERLPGPGKHGL